MCLAHERSAMMTSTFDRRAGRSPGLGFQVATCLLTLALVAVAAPSSAGTDHRQGSWNPVASEKLIKLPGSYLKKAIENDFSNSGLAAALRDAEISMGLKAQTLADLQGAIDQADGELKVDLQHQFLAEKRDYLELVGRHQDLRREQMTTKMRLYERLLGKLSQDDAAMTPARRALVEKQDEARRRFESSISKVDMKLFSTPMISESKYTVDYAKNVVAIERLVQAIQAHPMNAQSEINGRAVTKQEFLRQAVADTQAELAIVDQEETVLGYMAKLIALDALALTEAVADVDGEPENEDQTVGLAAAVDYFIPQ
jgi:hypothetical protein